MTTNREFDRQLADWLHETSVHRVPDHVVDVLLVTRATRQRPWWSSLERWLPMDLSMRTTAVRWPNLGRIVVVALIVLAIIAAAILFAGSQRRFAPPFGPARNGVIAFAASGDIYSLASIDAAPRTLVGGTTTDVIPSFRRDGAQLQFVRDTHGAGKGYALMTADADGSNVRQLVDLSDLPSAGDTSPDGSTLVFTAPYEEVTGTYSIATTGSGLPRPMDLGAGEMRWLGWRPPYGRELIYLQIRAGHFVFSRAAPDGGHQAVIKDIGTLDQNSDFNFNPSLTPDGRSVVYSFSDGDHFHNYVLDLDTGAVRQLSLGPVGGHELHGVVSPDGTKLLFHDTDGTPVIQEMLAPIDGSSPAIRIGPPYPIVDGSADLSQAFSPDGRSILIMQGRDREVRIVDAMTGGDGRRVAWQADDLPDWQRLAP